MGYRKDNEYARPTLNQVRRGLNKSMITTVQETNIASSELRSTAADGSRLLHELLHTWNLPADTAKRCNTYELRSMYAPQLQENLRHHIGLLSFKGKQYVPVYQNCTRLEIGTQAKGNMPQEFRYFISFRELGALRIALIQPEYQRS